MFVCPACGRARLAIQASLELSHPSWDDFTVQTVRCGACGFGGAAVYRESRRGALDSETVDHAGYRLSAADLEWLCATIRACRRKRSSTCDCPSHRALNARCGPGGEWPNGCLTGPEEQFAMTFGGEP